MVTMAEAAGLSALAPDRIRELIDDGRLAADWVRLPLGSTYLIRMRQLEPFRSARAPGVDAAGPTRVSLDLHETRCRCAARCGRDAARTRSYSRSRSPSHIRASDRTASPTKDSDTAESQHTVVVA